MDERPRILGVDDSLTIRRALEIVLKPAGYELDLASDGAEAFAKAKAIKPALILLDFILPDMRGTDVCRQLAADPDTAKIPVVLISAKGAEIRQAYQDIGNVVSYIPKPFKPQEVTSVVADVLERASSGELFKLVVPGHDDIAAASAPAHTPEQERAAVTAQPGVPLAVSPASADATSYETETAAFANGHDEFEEAEHEEAAELAGADAALSATVRRESLEWMFEVLRAGIEGVYVEEIDTPTGAAADQAKTYTDIIEQLSTELAESLRHLRSGTRYTLYGDGSVRSIDETLLDVFRRSGRLLFRAAVAGVVGGDAASQRPRILVACHADSPVHEQVQSLLAAHPEWQVFVISEGFRQLPMMTRLYGPTHLVAEVTWAGGLWDQLSLLQRMPEARGLTVLGIADPVRLLNADATNDRAAAVTARGITRLVTSAFDLEGMLVPTTDTATKPSAMPAAVEATA